MAHEIRTRKSKNWDKIVPALDMYRSGLSSYSISAKIDVPSRTIARWVRNNGLSRGHFGSTLRHNPETKKQALWLYKSGYTNKDIGEKLSVKSSTIRNWVKETGISRGRTGACGERNYFWEGGKTSENAKIRNSPEYLDWRFFILERDSFACQRCFCVGGELHVHHIMSFSKYENLRFNSNNGITLCVKCHSKIHGRDVSLKRRA